MPEQTTTPTNLQALQYLFDLARTAPASAPVHEQAKIYALQLNTLVNEDAIRKAVSASDTGQVAEAIQRVVDSVPAESVAKPE